MKAFEDKIRQFIDKHRLLKAKERILVAVSGGPDSMALLQYLQSAKLYDITVAHVDHMLRGDDSAGDADYVENFCSSLGISVIIERVDVQAIVKKEHVSIEVAARMARYKFFEEVMRKHHIEVLVTGHHGDDQIETMLMRLTRGSTVKGIAGIEPSRPFFHHSKIVRPFLCVTKDEIEDYCTASNIEPRVDMTNFEDYYQRNRFRQHILPFLKKENSHVHAHFQKMSEELLEMEGFMQEYAKDKLTESWIETSTGGELKIPLFFAMPLPLQRRCIQLILYYLYKEKLQMIHHSHVEAIFTLLFSNHPSGQLDLPHGVKVVRSYDTCLFLFRAQKQSITYQYELKEGLSVQIPNGYQLTLYKKGEMKISSSCSMFFDPTEISLPLYVRSRKDGDRMKVKGLNGTKKVKDIFINAKVPLEKRNNWPIVTDGRGEIIWLPTLRKSEYDQSENDKIEQYQLVYEKVKSSRGQQTR